MTSEKYVVWSRIFLGIRALKIYLLSFPKVNFQYTAFIFRACLCGLLFLRYEVLSVGGKVRNLWQHLLQQQDVFVVIDPYPLEIPGETCLLL
jgi:hypothetical protein